MMVPAVTEVCLPQRAHSQVHALVCSGQALPTPQAGQTKPFGQRAANRYRTQAASSGKRLWNSIRERGKSDMSGLRRAYVRSMFYHQPTLSTTANGGPGRTGISLPGLIVRKLDRLARSMKQLIETIEELRQRGIGFRSLTEALDTTTAQGRLVFTCSAHWRNSSAA